MTYVDHGHRHGPGGTDPIPNLPTGGGGSGGPPWVPYMLQIQGGGSSIAAGATGDIGSYSGSPHTNDIDAVYFADHAAGIKVLAPSGLLEVKVSIYGVADAASYAGVRVDIYNSSNVLSSSTGAIYGWRYNYVVPGDSNRRYICEALIASQLSAGFYQVVVATFKNTAGTARSPYGTQLYVKRVGDVFGSATDGSW